MQSEDHKDFTSSDLKEDEQISIDPAITSKELNILTKESKDNKRLNRNSNSSENENNNILNSKNINISNNINNNNSDENNLENSDENIQEEVNHEIVLNLYITFLFYRKKSKQNNKIGMSNKVYEQNKPSMERISEADNEDEKYNTVFDKNNDGPNRDEYKIDEKHFDEFMNRNINSSNMKEYYDPNPNIYNTDSTYRFKHEITQNNKINNNDQVKMTTEHNKRVEVIILII